MTITEKKRGHIPASVTCEFCDATISFGKGFNEATGESFSIAPQWVLKQTLQQFGFTRFGDGFVCKNHKVEGAA